MCGRFPGKPPSSPHEQETLEPLQRTDGDASGVTRILFPDADLLMPHHEEDVFPFQQF